jgi:hypothetical protein
MKNNYIYIIEGQDKHEIHWTNLGYWLSLGTAKADLKRMKANGILQYCYAIQILQVKIGRYHEPKYCLREKCINNQWVEDN